MAVKNAEYVDIRYNIELSYMRIFHVDSPAWKGHQLDNNNQDLRV